jgi:hypothetical protein
MSKALTPNMKATIEKKSFRCGQCDKLCTSSWNHTRFCSTACSRAYWLAAYQKDRGNYSKDLSTGTVGAISELRVCADLLAKGYEVFRAVSQSCSCDLAILKNQKLTRIDPEFSPIGEIFFSTFAASKSTRIEVRTGFETAKGKIHAPRKYFRADIMAIVLPSRIIYEPDIEGDLNGQAAGDSSGH